jgi:hypothetical protein
MLSSVAPSLAVERPYPGLRPFESHEAFLFRGRELHTQALLDRLASEHFLAVVGTSGSGKSSLVRAGLLPALYRGYLVGASTHWRIAVMRPGGAPLAELDRALADALADRVEPVAYGGGPLAQVVPVRDVAPVPRTSLDCTRAVRQANLPDGTNFLLVVDQFEELFRFETERRSADGGAEAALFVQNLLEAADSYDERIYVVLTIRSDFLGRCAQFRGLPEALNRAQYLIPHLTREQRQQAIELPPQLGGVRVKPALVQKLLNDLGDDPAMLPVLQHALMRTFSKRKPGDQELTFEHYEQAGGIASALNDHAESLVKQLADGPRRHVERLFRCLTTVEGGRPVRRPARLDRIYAVLGVAADPEGRREVDAVVRTFAAEENSLLVSSSGSELTASSVIDVSHETLIQNWAALKGWLHAEIRSVDWYRSLAGDYVRFYDHDASPWRDPELKRALALKESDRWNEAWAEQYLPKKPHNPTFAEVMRFIGLSVVQQREDEERQETARRRELEDAQAIAAADGRSKRLYRGLTWAMVALLALGGLTAYLYVARQEQEQRSLQNAITAETERQEKLEALRKVDETLGQLEQNSAQANALSKQKALLESRLDELSQEQAKLRNDLRSATTQSSKSSYSEALIAIKNLQDDLDQARRDRDDARAEVKRLNDLLTTKSAAAAAPQEKTERPSTAQAQPSSGPYTVTTASRRASAAFGRGVEAFNQRQWQEAERELRDAIAAQAVSKEAVGSVVVGGSAIPWSPRTYLAVLYGTLNRCAEARGLFSAANLEAKTVPLAQQLLATSRKCAAAK